MTYLSLNPSRTTRLNERVLGLLLLSKCVGSRDKLDRSGERLAGIDRGRPR